MSTVVKVEHNGQVTIPTRLRTKLGLADGDLVEASTEDGRIILTPKISVSTPSDEYTPTQRRVIDSRLSQSLEQVKRGEIYGPFNTHEELITFLHGEANNARVKKSRSRRSSSR